MRFLCVSLAEKSNRGQKNKHTALPTSFRAQLLSCEHDINSPAEGWLDLEMEVQVFFSADSTSAGVTYWKFTG